MKIILWNMMTNILITPMLKNREQHFMVLFFYGIDMQRINVYRVVINFQVTKNNGKIYIIDPVKIELIRTEGRELALYDLKKERYVLNKPLYEVQEQLGKDFVRISKFAIINIKRINHVEASFNGTMEIVMKNGLEEIITRSYRKLFKERLGV